MILKKNIPNFFLLISVACYLFYSCKNNAPTVNTSQPISESPKSGTENKQHNIIFFGNSLTAGYGLENPANGFVALIQKRLDSLKLPYNCINAGLSGETTIDGSNRVEWTISQQNFDIFILELGGNDALRGTPASEAQKNLQIIIDKVRAKNPSATIILAGMEAPRNLGKKYTDAFHDIFPVLAKKNNIALIPFILDNVAGLSQLNQGDGIHPNIAGNLIVRENIWTVLKTLLKN